MVLQYAPRSSVLRAHDICLRVALRYTALDMRLLHVFLVDAYPHMPLEAAPIWQRDVPQWAHVVSAREFVTAIAPS